MSKNFEYTRVIRDTNESGAFYQIELEDRAPSELEVLILPELSRAERRKELLECTSNLLCQITSGLSKNCEYGSDVTEDGLNIEMTHALRELGNLAQYIVNSSSFGNDYVAGFDAMEFERRLDMIKSLFYRGTKGLNKCL